MSEKGPRKRTTGGKRDLPSSGLVGVGGVAAAERQQAVELAAVGAGDFIEQIPGRDAQRLALVELGVQVRRLEVGEA